MPSASRAGRKPRDEIIEREIKRRLASGEPITYRAVRSAVGGAPATIKRVLDKLNLGTDARGTAAREVQVRERLRDAGAKLAEADAYVRGAREAGVALAGELTGALTQVRDAHGILVKEIDVLRGLVRQLAHELAAQRPASDPLMEARLRRANADNGKMAERIEQLKRRLFEAGVEDP